MTTDGDRDKGDDDTESSDRDDTATQARPAPSPDRRVSWGSDRPESRSSPSEGPSNPPPMRLTPAPAPATPPRPPASPPSPLFGAPKATPSVDAPRAAPPAPPRTAPPAPPPPPAPRPSEPPTPSAGPGRRTDGPMQSRFADRSGSSMAELAQQLAATQAQVASISAQLTTLAHRITYDLERGAQTTSERILRDLEHLPDQVSFRVGAHLGPAVDDLTDQVESDSERLRQVIEKDFGDKLTLISETVEALPLGTSELLNGLQTATGDLEDRLTRFASRVGDQVSALERSTHSDLTSLRERLEELKAATQPKVEEDAIERMAGQIERLVERPTGTSEVIDAIEVLIGEHLEVLRDNVETRVAALAPVLHEELEAVRAEALAGVSATEEVLSERIEAMEVGLAERVDAALGDQVDAVDAILAERHEALLGAVTTTGGDAGFEELANTVASLVDRVEEVMTAVVELQEAQVGGDPMEAVNEELKALRRRISVRLESADEPQGLTPEQLKELAAQIALHLS